MTKMTRKEFLNTAAGAAALAAIPSSAAAVASCAQPAASTGKIKRGVSIYSYSGVLNTRMTLEDCFADMYDMGIQGVEILASHVENYPNPTDEWVEWWWNMMEKYELTPSQFGHWVDSKIHPGQETSTQESYEMLVRDLRLAHRLGFNTCRTTIGIIDILRTPVKNWAEFTEMALPVAEELGIKMGVELHKPTKLDDTILFDTFVDFIERTGTKNYGFTLDFGVFDLVPPGPDSVDPHRPSTPEEAIPLLPYINCCHAKFNNMTDDLQCTGIPVPEIIKVMQDHGWEGFLNSEYEGPNKTDRAHTSDQLRRQHVQLKRVLGEV